MYEELKKLAENATQGPWVAAGPSFGSDSPQYCEEVLVDRAGDEDDTYTVCQAPTGLEKESTADMEFIAAANPSAVLALIAEVERLKKMRALDHSLNLERKLIEERDKLKAENEALRKAAQWVIQVHRDPELCHEIPNEEWLEDLEAAMAKDLCQ